MAPDVCLLKFLGPVTSEAFSLLRNASCQPGSSPTHAKLPPPSAVRKRSCREETKPLAPGPRPAQQEAEG